MSTSGTGNGGSNGLNKLLGALNLPNNWLVVAIVLLSGGGNLLTTQNGNNTILKNTASEEDLKKAVAEVHDIHRQIDKFANRQKQILSALKVSPTPGDDD